jgi:hypothetical protein
MKKFSLVFCSFLLIFSFYSSAAACACCSETGTYHLWTGKPENYTLDLISEFEFNEKSYLMITVAGFDGIKGLDVTDKDFETSNKWDSFGGDLDFTSSYAAKTWTLNFKTKSGKKGSLTLPMPAQMVTFKADIHDGRRGGGGGPLLYKEFRFEGNISSGKGFFQKGIVKPTKYMLVFKGRGNGCDNTQDFTHWYLEVRGKNASYELIGRLDSGEADYIFDKDEPKDSESEN